MHVSVRNRKVTIERETFIYLFDNSIYYEHPEYLEAIKNDSIAMAKLIMLSREASINYPLFFVPFAVIKTMLDKENKKLFQGFGGKFTLSIRGRQINLNLVRLIIKDLKIKQAFITKYMNAPKNPHLRFLANSPKNSSEQAQYILNTLNIDINLMRTQRSKATAMMYLIDQLEKQNILTSIETRTNMPQNMNHARGISGVYVKDSRFPYFFIANEGQANFGDGAGRKIFTIMYLTACMFKGRSKLVSLEEKLSESKDREIYEIVEEILLPKNDIPYANHYTLDELDDLSSHLKVTARAILVRLKHLKYIDDDNYWRLMTLLKNRYSRLQEEQKRLRKDKGNRYVPNIPTNILAYHGKAYIKILKALYSNGQVTQRQINLHLSYGRQEIKTSELFKKV